MKYMIVWSVAPEQVQASRERWGEKEPVEAFKIHQRWNELGTGKGFTLIETDDVAALTRYNSYWQDIVDLKIVPVIDDEETRRALTD